MSVQGCQAEPGSGAQTALSRCEGSTERIQWAALGVGLCIDCAMLDMDLCQGAMPDMLSMALQEEQLKLKDKTSPGVIHGQKVVSRNQLEELSQDGDAQSGAYPSQSRWMDHLDSNGLTDRFLRFPWRPATDAELNAVHDAQYLDAMRYTASNGPNQVDLSVLELSPPNSCNYQRTRYTLGDAYQTWHCQHSFLASSYCAGGMIEMAKAAIRGEIKAGLAVGGGGHHVGRCHTGGFGHLNELAIVARAVQPEVSRVIILDWDIHCGEGTSDIFWEDPSVMYISIHRYDNGRYWPGSPEGEQSSSIPTHTSPECTGGPGAEGFNVNCVWGTENGTDNLGVNVGDKEYMEMMDSVVTPLARKFNPGLILVFSGMDAALGDPTGHCSVTAAGYQYMTEQIMSLNKPLVIEAIGGYGEFSHAPGFVAIARTLLGCSESMPTPNEAESPSMARVQDLHYAYHVQCRMEAFRVQQSAWLGNPAPSVADRRPRWTLAAAMQHSAALGPVQHELSAVEVEVVVQTIKDEVSTYLLPKASSSNDFQMIWGTILEMAYDKLDKAEQKLLPARIVLQVLAAIPVAFCGSDRFQGTSMQAAADFVAALKQWVASAGLQRLSQAKFEALGKCIGKLMQGELLDLSDMYAWEAEGLGKVRDFLAQTPKAKECSFLREITFGGGGWDDNWDDNWDVGVASYSQDGAWIVEKILEERAGQGRVEYLVLWHGYTQADASWQTIQSLHGVGGADLQLEAWAAKS